MDLVLIAHNLRSAHNVGSILRTAEGLGVNKVFLSGYTPYPKEVNDKRLPHLADKISSRIRKTSLGAETTLVWQHNEDIVDLIQNLKADGYEVIALEQTNTSIDLDSFKPSPKTALIVGREVEGIEPEVLKITDRSVQIAMAGQKESFNVAVAAALALYHLKHKGDGHLA